MSRTSHKPRVLLGVTGSAAAYKAAALARLLVPRYDVRIVATAAALKLARLRDLQKASGHPVGVDGFRGVKPVPAATPEGSHPVFRVPHIEFARECDLLLVAPATADFLGKMALGLADDLLSSCCLYSSCPVMAAPAMNQAMWRHPAVQRNVSTLRERGVILVGPESGHLACGDQGEGRMASPASIAREVDRFLARRSSWKGRCVLVTAGPTQEPLDPVRVLTNHSSGKMGYAIAREALRRGASVVLVSGPVSLDPPAGARMVRVESARDMHDAVLRLMPEADIAVMAAAVADYRPAVTSPSKIKKRRGPMTLRLEPTPDILAEVLRRRRSGQRIVGFAAETGDLEKRAREKWARKPCDMLVANLVGAPGTGFHGDTNEATVFVKGRKGPVRLGRDLKTRMAESLLDLMEKAWNPPNKQGV